jgi:hypothetical protein
MKLDKSIAVFAMVASLMLAMSAATAQSDFDSNPEQVSVDGDSETLQGFESSASGQADLIGGNVSNYNISGEQTTNQWAGIYGTATGSLVLGSNETGNSGVFYEWGDATVDNVYIDSFGSINWGNLTPGAPNNVTDAYGMIDSGDTDNASATYDTSEPYEIGNSTNEYTLPTAETRSNITNDEFKTGIIQDVDNEGQPANGSAQPDDPFFVAKVDDAADKGAFNGEPADYQAIVPAAISDDPEDGSTTYDLYVELS